MLNEVMGKLVEEFDQKQDALLAAIGGSFDSILLNMKRTAVLNHGSPPFILDDGDTPLLFLNEDGSYVKLPPTFILSEETTSQEFDVIYALPVVGFGTIRFIPALSDKVAPVGYQSKFVASAYSPQFLGGLGKYLEVMSNALPQLAEIRLARRLIQLQPAMESSAKEAQLDLESFMEMREVRDAFVSVLGEAFVDGAKRASEMVVEARSES